jgi:hypothetical protein
MRPNMASVYTGADKGYKQRGHGNYQHAVTMLSATLLSASLLLAAKNAVQAASVSSVEWQALNISVGGRLHKGAPLALPCFSNYNGVDSAANPSACAIVESEYTDATFRSNNFGAYMQVSWQAPLPRCY